MEPTQVSFVRFPLVARPRPACAPLNTRVGDLCELAGTAERDSDTSKASTVFNPGRPPGHRPRPARPGPHLVPHHAALYLTSCPLTGRAARHALEPS
ncbi:hypothetical protein SAMN05421833_12931 [Microbispora rosea]|uniref:Uncharacterized protein n=1 Tax=Microbispora rosea TaxID=58117 RepID=A0A1N7GHY7_9ACTN|nr:hypothetical protein [Microbispora rosea]GIH51617.1 hypothetical protein Mro03_67960 [Microbispora rosea subsp. rosea]SIS12139.1 hypothetical protein SAMN05421833_12931 [Microbispora rosea]